MRNVPLCIAVAAMLATTATMPATGAAYSGKRAASPPGMERMEGISAAPHSPIGDPQLRDPVRWARNAFLAGRPTGEPRASGLTGLLDSEKLPVEIVVEAWDTNFATWMNIFRSSLTLDGSFHVTESLNQFWAGIQWMNFSSDLFTYNEYDDVLTHIYREFPMGFWELRYRETSQYSEPGRRSTILRENHNGSVYVNSRHDEFSYDGSGNEILQLVRTWSGASWDSSSRVTRTWDTEKHELSRTFEIYSGGNWINATRELATYDSAGNIIEIVQQYWGGSAWVNGTQRAFTYDEAGNPVTITQSNWNGIAWENDFRFVEFYDSEGFLIQESYHEWDGFDWLDVMISYVTTDGEGFPVEIYTQEKINDTWENTTKINFIWQKILSDVAGGGDIAAGYQLAGNYPNPFNPSTEIGFTVPSESYVRLSVYNLIGKEVAVLVDGRRSAGSHSVRWDPADASSGVYFYKLQAGEFTQTKRMLLVR